MSRLPYVTRKKVTQPDNCAAFLEVLKDTPLECEVNQTVRGALSLRKNGIGEDSATELTAKLFAFCIGVPITASVTVEHKWLEREARHLADMNRVI